MKKWVKHQFQVRFNVGLKTSECNSIHQFSMLKKYVPSENFSVEIIMDSGALKVVILFQKESWKYYEMHL